MKTKKNFFYRLFHPDYIPGGWLWGVIRIAMGWIFFWAFVDKLFGLGFATTADKAWIAGGSPTFGFLSFGTHGPFSGFFQLLAGHPLVDALFMLGLLGVGVGLIFGIAMRLSAYSGSVMLLLMWLASLPPANNPFLDEHLIYIVILLALTILRADRTLGFAKKWKKTNLVKKYPLFE